MTQTWGDVSFRLTGVRGPGVREALESPRDFERYKNKFSSQIETRPTEIQAKQIFKNGTLQPTLAVTKTGTRRPVGGTANAYRPSPATAAGSNLVKLFFKRIEAVGFWFCLEPQKRFLSGESF